MLSEHRNHPTTVLLVEDDETVRDAVHMMLERAGYEVTAAPNGVVAARLLGQWRPDLVITDIFMPDGDGLETLNVVKSRWPGVPVIAISGGSPMHRLDYLGVANDLGAAAVMNKPFEAESFLSTVANVLAEAVQA